ncbi:MAG: CYTH domain-containing protein [Oscillospiraceae bacterium]
MSDITSAPKEIERKYLIIRPTDKELSAIPGIEITDITQIYLKTDNNLTSRRVRKRGNSEKGYKFTFTEKKDISFGQRYENECEITEGEYVRLLSDADPDRAPVEKQRCCFTFDGQFFELDLYPFSDEYATLEIELDDINTPVRLPHFIEVVKDVTGDKRYSNFALALTRRLTLFDEEN